MVVIGCKFEASRSLNVLYAFIFQNLCIAAAYRPVEELLEKEKKVRLGFYTFFMIYILYSSSFYSGAWAITWLFLFQCLCLPGSDMLSQL